MMLKRLHIFRFHSPVDKPRKINACAKCFATFLLKPAGEAEGQQSQQKQQQQQKRKRSVDGWTVHDVVAFLGNIELQHLASGFIENGIDGPMRATYRATDD